MSTKGSPLKTYAHIGVSVFAGVQGKKATFTLDPLVAMKHWSSTCNLPLGMLSRPRGALSKCSMCSSSCASNLGKEAPRERPKPKLYTKEHLHLHTYCLFHIRTALSRTARDVEVLFNVSTQTPPCPMSHHLGFAKDSLVHRIEGHPKCSGGKATENARIAQGSQGSAICH